MTLTNPVSPPVKTAIGTSAQRSDAIPKATGQFAFASDLPTNSGAHDTLWGTTLRSPHPSAQILSIDTSAAQAMRGVHSVIVASDLPGATHFGIDRRDQPVLADDIVRYQGEPVALIAADDPDLCRRALDAISVRYHLINGLFDPTASSDAPPIHPDGNVIRHLSIQRGQIGDHRDLIAVEGDFEVGVQDQAFLGPEATLAVPNGSGVHLHVSTQHVHLDHAQLPEILGLAPDAVRVTLAGVGGAFGGREDITTQAHAALLALATGRPVTMHYDRTESFFGHVHRHPARMWYRHTATRDGLLHSVEARIVLDGGAYASSTSTVVSNAACFAAGPYAVPNVSIDTRGVRTNNPPAGAMRGFGAVQVCFAHEAQMDALARKLGIDPVEFRRRNALGTGDTAITGQHITTKAPVRDLLDMCSALAIPPPDAGRERPPGGNGNTADLSRIRRGVGYAAGMKNLMFSEGHDDATTVQIAFDGETARVLCAITEMGQGIVTVIEQITTDLLGALRVEVEAPDSTAPDAGSASASRSTWMCAGALELACAQINRRRADEPWPIEATATFHHAPTSTLDDHGQGEPHAAFSFAVHRAVVDVDLDLGLVSVVELATAQDTGTVINPAGLAGQVEGGSAQGLGLAIMEELIIDDGHVRNPSFTDYLIPTSVDMAPVRMIFHDDPEPTAPLGVKGAGEAPTISSGAAILAAIRDATGLALRRAPIRPHDIALPSDPTPEAER